MSLTVCGPSGRTRDAAVDAVLARPLVIVLGKGGVGRSTVAAVLGLAADREGRAAMIVEVGGRDDVARSLGAPAARDGTDRVLGDRLCLRCVDVDDALADYLRDRLPGGPLAAGFARTRVFGSLAAAAPGLREMLTIGKVWDLTRPGRDTPPCRPVILDAPATGHALALLRAPRSYAGLAGSGPVGEQAGTIAAFLRDPRSTAFVVVSTPQDLAVAETAELVDALRDDLGVTPALAVVNGVLGDEFTAAEVARLRAAPPSPARHAALFAAGRHEHQQEQIERLHAVLPDVPTIELPLLLDDPVDFAALRRLAAQLMP
jgi:anion-transporting  ArsA/GET3 family ATPase